MTLTTTQALLIALAVTAGTVITRFLPFLLFPDSCPVPKLITYLGRTLPAAMMGLLPAELFRRLCPPRPAGAYLHSRDHGAAPVEAQRAAVHRRRHGALHGAGSGRICVNIFKALCPWGGEPFLFIQPSPQPLQRRA